MGLERNRLVGYQVPKARGTMILRVVLASMVATLAILAVLPITQAISGDPRDNTIRSVDTAKLPPPEPPPPEPPPPPEEEPEEIEDLEETPPQLDLRSLEAALNPGLGDAVGNVGGFDLFEVRPNAAAEMQIFQIGDLDRPPKRLRGVNPPYPRDMQRQKITGMVRLVLLIDEEGYVDVLEVLQTPHPGFIKPVTEAVETWQFESPRKDGKKVKARYVLPLNFSL